MSILTIYFIVKPDKIKLDGEHIENQDVSYKIWQKIKDQYPTDFDAAVPLSEWKQLDIDVDEEFMGLMACTDTKSQHKMLATDTKYREKNRYTDILPFERTRVKLQ